MLEFDGSYMLTVRYTHGPGIDEPLVMERGGQSFSYHADGLGSITELTDSTGAVVQSYVYDSFGQIVQQVGTLASPYTYTGREFDEESGLYYYRTRYYDARVGRFLQEDSFRGIITIIPKTLNVYVYVLNNPLTNIDPYGNNPLLLTAAIGSLTGIVIGGTVGGFTAFITEGNVLNGVIVGAVGGGVGGLFAGFGMPTTAGALGSLAGQAVAEFLNGTLGVPGSYARIAASPIIGGFLGYYGGQLANHGFGTLGRVLTTSATSVNKAAFNLLTRIIENVSDLIQQRNRTLESQLSFCP